MYPPSVNSIVFPWKQALLVYISCLLILSNDIERNPGPRTPKFPCGICTKAVRWNDKGVACDSCNSWFHTKCIGMCDEIYHALAPDISWHCFTCGLPNFSTRLFTDTPSENALPPSLENLTHASTASIDSSIHPDPCSPKDNLPDKTIHSPTQILRPPMRSSSPCLDSHKPNNLTETTFSSISSAPDLLSDLAKPVHATQSLRTLVINFRSIRNKKQEFWNILECTKPDIILGTETWLNPGIFNSEFMPPTFDVYRRDRPDGWGGVLVDTRKNLISHQLPLPNNAEAVLVSIQTKSKSSKLTVGCLYRPPSSTTEQNTKDMLAVIDQACSSPNNVIFLEGDLNLPDINWSTLSVESSRYPK